MENNAQLSYTDWIIFSSKVIKQYHVAHSHSEKANKSQLLCKQLAHLVLLNN